MISCPKIREKQKILFYCQMDHKITTSYWNISFNFRYLHCEQWWGEEGVIQEEEQNRNPLSTFNGKSIGDADIFLIMSVWVMICMIRVVWIQHMNVKHVSKRKKKQGHRYGPSWICRNSTSVFANFSFLDLLIWPFCICDAYHHFFWNIAGFPAKQH